MIEHPGVKGDTTIGVLCLDTAFTKIPGHIRNRTTFDFPVIYQVVQGATPQRMVTEADPTLLEPFIIAAKELEAQGAAAITSGCGFLVIFQQQLADAVQIPLYSSSLIQVPMVHRMLAADRKVGLLVAKKEALTQRHLQAVGAESVPICVAGMDAQPEFREVILEGRRNNLDADRLGREVLHEIDQLAAANPEMGALVIECTDLVPYGHAIQSRLRIPVFDIVTLTEMVHRSLSHRPFRG
ncbi:aspartate/glutamate racemase family protein [Nocardia sp. NPDC060256]|uniref:aspartate/glutamate racemase family protein n=1 Tax=unclassified Nocardia TaxID=2637762 RepID=UPI00365629C7